MNRSRKMHSKRTASLWGLFLLASASTSCGSEVPGDIVENALELERRAEGATRSSVTSPFVPFGSLLTENSSERSVEIFFDGFGQGFGFSPLSGMKDLAKGISEPHELLQLLGSGFRWSGSQGLVGGDGLRSERRQLELNGIPVHNAVSISQSDTWDHDRTVWLRASLPHWAGQTEGTAFAPSFTEGVFTYTGQETISRYCQESGFAPRYVVEANQIYYPLGDKLHAAYRLLVTSDPIGGKESPPVPLRAIVDAETGHVLEQVPLALHVTGSAKLYPENSVASASVGLISRSLPGLTDPGNRLSSPLFDVKNCQSQVVGSQCTFVAAPQSGADYSQIGFEEDSYDELVAYYAIAGAIDWYRKLMGDSSGSFEKEDSWKNRANFGLGTSASTKLTVNVRAITRTPGGNFTPDNAVYLPGGSVGTGGPEIVIGTGWEASQNTPARALRYIGKDSDVSMHEFGHHIVFRSVTEIRGQALAMHEGFADYFTYAKTGNIKLAESVVSGGDYLRSANRKGTLEDYPPSTTAAHDAGEFWSTALWDVRKELGDWNGSFYKFDKIAYHAIDLMQAAETYYGAIAALARSAEIFALSNGEDPVALKEKLYSVFYQRGFLMEPNGSGTLPGATPLLTESSGGAAAIAGDGSAGSSSSGSGSSRKKNVLGLSCSVGVQNSVPQAHDLGTLLLLLGLIALPLLRLRRQFQSQMDTDILYRGTSQRLLRAAVRVARTSKRR